jgi:AraC-like DNA-binding protein
MDGAVAKFSTEGLEDRDQFDGWREQLGPRFGVAEVTRQGTGRFSAAIETSSIGRLSVSEISADAMTFHRTRHHVSHRERDEFTVGLMVEGAAIVEQDGREALLVPGDLVLCDNRRPYRIRFDQPFRQIVFNCERVELEARLPDADRRTAHRIEGKGAVPSMTAAYVASIAKGAPGSGAAAHAVAQHTFDLLALTVGHVSVPAPSSTLLLARVHAFIDEHLSDPDLTPALIARHHRISRRQLYRLFDESGDTIAAYIRRRRLLRCQAMLADMRQARRSVSEIAFAMGFNDATTFGRAFREAFGVTPRDYRRTALGRDDGAGRRA